jgi:hypothetical protein
MNKTTIRRLLNKQIDRLPDELVRQVADFTLFLTARQQVAPRYEDWSDQQWQDFSLQQFFHVEEGDADAEVEYSLKEAREVYHP